MITIIVPKATHAIQGELLELLEIESDGEYFDFEHSDSDSDELIFQFDF